MSKLVRRTTQTASPMTRVVFVRQPVRQVGRHEHHDPRPLRLAVAALSVLAGIAIVWLMGHLGFRLGFASVIGVPGLLAQPQDGLVGGILILLNMPFVIIAAGLVEPIWLMLAIVLIGMPAASLGAARPFAPGGPRPSQLAATMSIVGAVAAMVNAVLLLAWTVSPWRLNLTGALPAQLADHASWFEQYTLAAGMDLLALICATLWVVLLARLRLALWLKALALTVSAFAVAATALATAVTNGALAQLDAPRMVAEIARDGDGDGSAGPAGAPPIVLGSTREHLAVLRRDDDTVAIELLAPPARLEAIDRRSILDLAARRRRGPQR